jgi:cytochrome c oxidase subunit 2
MSKPFQLFPDQASTIASEVDALYLFLVAVATFFTLLIGVLVITFAIKYRRNAVVDRSNPPSSTLLEVSWSIVPLVLSLVMFYWGAVVYFRMHQPPAEVDEIYVVAKQWMWKIQHPNGRREVNELHIPVGRPVALKMISEDVIHDFYVPAFRVKKDVLPGRFTQMWFEPTKVGSYHLFCAEYCGTSHSQMIGKVVVMEPSDYAAWLSGETVGQPAEVTGKQLFEQFRCDTCHRQEGRCPPLEGIFGRTVRLANGQTKVADEDYLRRSILEPNADVVAGYQAAMPTYKGQIGEEGILQIIAYLKTLQGSPATTGEQADQPPNGSPEAATSPESNSSGGTPLDAGDSDGNTAPAASTSTSAVTRRWEEFNVAHDLPQIPECEVCEGGAVEAKHAVFSPLEPLGRWRSRSRLEPAPSRSAVGHAEFAKAC